MASLRRLLVLLALAAATRSLPAELDQDVLQDQPQRSNLTGVPTPWVFGAGFAMSNTSGTTSTVKGQQFPSLINVTIDDLVAGLTSGLFTSVDLVHVRRPLEESPSELGGRAVALVRLTHCDQAYISRIAQVNGTLHPVTEINPDALEIAAQLDADRKQGKTLG
jgi:hypothetical protein